ncbi:MAG: phosphomethylpyrimidine synthase ThiC, partial [Proteobacteria bacterium]|nr:phosphomethylpyrimidine synthase ThiC [Pseudomonadota bacterium]
KYGKRDRDRDISRARRDLKWDEQFSLALYGDTAAAIRESRRPAHERSCTMCGSFCSMENGNIYFSEELKKSPKR